MRKLPKGLNRKIKDLALEVARFEFIEMINPAMPGSAWDWSCFPEWIERRIVLYLQEFPLTDKQREKDWDAIVHWARRYGRIEGEKILQTTDVCRWSKYVV